jgi:LmbE family N-acetylglucosaminyl deacetylase
VYGRQIAPSGPGRGAKIGAMSSTVVFLHAHPDDEAIATGGTMARLAAEGNRVVLVLATRGELGKPREGVLDPGEILGDRRAQEAERAGEILGAARVAFLGYRDSGMMGEATNDEDGTFWTADVDTAAHELADLLREEDADVLVVYDDHGGYGHPDHIQVHRVGIRAAELAGTPRVYESTVNREKFQQMMERMREAQVAQEFELNEQDVDELADEEFAATFGSPEAIITTTVDVGPYLDTKRAAMAAHASQIGPEMFFLQLPDEAFRFAFGEEWFIRRDVDRTAHRESWILDDLPVG